MKSTPRHLALLAASLGSFLPLTAFAELPTIKAGVSAEGKNPFENSDASVPQKEAASSKSEKSSEQKSVSSKSSSSTSISSSTSSVNGKTVTTTRSIGPDGKEKITISTQGRSGKPKVETFTPEEYEQKFGPKKKPQPAEPSAEKSPTPANSNSQRATE